mmetsp:Transcript_45892/g.121317  ORF Transcript_45892/g.121317 Transcript_45892/m.121317 type:complete len:200 (-) Transcript_45892:1222-1821(-)
MVTVDSPPHLQHSGHQHSLPSHLVSHWEQLPSLWQHLQYPPTPAAPPTFAAEDRASTPPLLVMRAAGAKSAIPSANCRSRPPVGPHDQAHRQDSDSDSPHATVPQSPRMLSCSPQFRHGVQAFSSPPLFWLCKWNSASPLAQQPRLATQLLPLGELRPRSHQQPLSAIPGPDLAQAQVHRAGTALPLAPLATARPILSQ